MIVRKLALGAVVALMSLSVFAQKSNVQNAYRALEKENLAEAIEYIELAAANSGTSNSVKMLNYRGKIYFAIHSSDSLEIRNLDEMAILKCAESWEAVAKHPKAKKWFDQDQINGNITKAGVGLFNRGVGFYSAGKNAQAMQLFNKIFDLLPLETKGDLERSNVTKESVYFNQFYVAYASKDFNASKGFLQQLIDVNYQEPQIYSYMATILQSEGNNEKALEYILLGREMFDYDVNLIIAELNYHLGNQDFVKAEELLTLAVEEDPNNHQLFFALGSSYANLGKFEKAETAYKEAVSIKPDFFDALYNLGVMYYNKGGEMIKEANNMSDWKKADAHTKKAEGMMLKALPHIEACYELEPNDKNILIVLKELYYRNGNDAAYKEVTSKLK